jgi:hypothetical protein
MTQKARSTVRADVRRNRLYISLPAQVSKKELEKVYTEIRFCVADLKPKFDVVTDLSSCTLAHLNGILVFRKIMDYLAVRQPGEVIRIVGRMSLLFRQLLRFASRFQGYKPVYVASLLEAEERLESITRRDGIRFQMLDKDVDYIANRNPEKGRLLDISTSGCAIEGPTAGLVAGEDLSIVVHLLKDQENLASFQLSAQVVRLEDRLFAVRFLEFDEAQKSDLYQCLTYEARRDISL